MRSVDSTAFAAALQRATLTPRGAYLTPYTAEELRDARCYLHPSGLAGGAVKVAADGAWEAVAVFNTGAPRGTGMVVLAHLAAMGATRLDCLGDGLRRAYERAGWVVDQVIDWCDDYAPAGWDYAAHGRPNVYVMTTTEPERIAA